MRGGRGEFAGMKGRAYQHRPNFYLGSAGLLRLSFCSVPDKVQATSNVAFNAGTPNLDLPFSVSAYCNVYATSTCLTTFVSFALDVVFIRLRR